MASCYGRRSAILRTINRQLPVPPLAADLDASEAQCAAAVLAL